MVSHNGDESMQWSGSELHKKIMKPGKKEDKIEAYTVRAPNYDTEATQNKYVAPGIVAKIVQETVLADPILKAKQTITVLDAGCGTGLAGEHTSKELKKSNSEVDVVGLDYAPAMLEVASEKNVYSDLLQADLDEPIPVNGRQFDIAIAVGVFFQGQCQPSALKNVLAGVAPGRYAIVTIRELTFHELRQEFETVIANSNCTIVQNTLNRYLGPVLAHYLVIKKAASS